MYNNVKINYDVRCLLKWSTRVENNRIDYNYMEELTSRCLTELGEDKNVLPSKYILLCYWLSFIIMVETVYQS